MKNLAIYLAAGATAVLVTAASAAPLSPNVSAAPESNIQNVRMVCNEAGQCWRQRGERRVIIRETAIHTDMLPVASAISSVAATGKVAASASARPASASESAPIATEKADNSLEYEQSRGEIRGFFSDANSNISER